MIVQFVHPLTFSSLIDCHQRFVLRRIELRWPMMTAYLYCRVHLCLNVYFLTRDILRYYNN